MTNGTTYYINCYDRYDDGWDGTTYEIRDAAGGAGTLVANNGGASPSDGNDEDSNSSWEDMDLERESSEAFSYTPPACPAPSGQTESNITDTSADLGWTENGSADHWGIEWGLSGFTQGAGTTVAVTSNPYNLSGLSANTEYDWYVRADCGASGGSGQSTWIGPHTFKTQPTPGTCGLFKVDLIDSWGDGWNGGTLDVYVNGTAYYTGLTLANGSGPESHYIPVDIGDILSFDYTAGNYSGENEYKVYDESDNLVADEGANGATPGDIGDPTIPSGLTACAQCPDPTLLTTSYPSNTSAELGWTENGSATTWNIEWGETGFSQGSGNMITGTNNNPETITGLTPRTDYDFYVQSDCGGGTTSNWTGPHTWTQPDVGDDCTLPILGTVVADCSSATPITLDFATAISEYLSGCDGGGNYGYWIKVTAPSSGAMKITNSGSQVGLVILDACGGSELYCNNNTLPAELSLTGFSPNTDYWFYFWKDNQSGTTDICFEDIPCPFPTSLSTSNETTSSAELSWTAGGSETQWNIEYGPTGFTQGSGTVINGVTTNPYTLTGLSEGTTYDWYIQADCGSDQSPWSGPSTFTTLVSNDDCSGAVALTVGAPGACPTNQVSSTANGSTDDGATSCDASGNIGVWFSFVAPASGEVVVNYTAGTATGNPGIVLFDACGGSEVSGTCQDNPAVLSNITGLTGGTTYYMLLWFDSGEGSFDICLEDVGTCPKPTGQTETNVSMTSVDLDWTENGTATTWDIEWGPSGFTQGSGTIVSGITSKPYNLTGLTAGTDYDWYVRADCGGGSQSPWEGPHTFTTSPVNDVCSGAIALTVGTSCTMATYTNENATDSGESPAPGCGSYNGADVWFSFVVPALGHVIIDSDVGDITDGAMAAYSGTCGALSLIECDDDDSANGAMPMLELTGLTPGETVYIRFWEFGGNVFGTFDICVYEGPCITPTNLSATNETSSGADLNWTENGGANHWDLYIVTAGSPAPDASTTPTVDNTTDNPYTWTGGAAATDYDWYVRADCGASGGTGQSDWSAKGTFTTTSADAVDWCNLQWPDQATITVGSSVDVYARVYEPGVTDASGQGAGISAWIGYSTTDTDPATWTNWVSATYNVDVGNNDEYQAALGAGLAPGTYYYASRFKLNDGVYKYGGYSASGGGFWDGTTYVSGVLTVTYCGGTFLDSGGDSNDYGNSEDITYKICPQNAGDVVTVTFTQFSSENSFSGCYDGMTVYDGDDTSAPVISSPGGSIDMWCFDRDENPPRGTGDLQGMVITSTHSSGCLTFVWHSDGSVAREGWQAMVSCSSSPPACPPSGLTVVPASANSVTANRSCWDNDWMHFWDSGSNQIVLSVKRGSGAVIGDGFVSVEAGGGTDAFWADNDPDGFPDVIAPNTGAAFMKRKWNVSSATQPSSDVGVRFYYTTDEFNAVNTEITSHGGTALTSTSQLNFYKVLNGEDPWNLSPGGVDSAHVELQTSGATAGINTFVDGAFAGEHYAEFLVAGFSGGGGGGASNGANLPLELLSFSGYADKDANVLKWTTVTESNTAMYYVEKSVSGAGWTLIAMVEAAGDSYTKKDYQAIDKEPVSKAYYRLRMMDKDGKYLISKVISIERKESGLKLNAVYPNPNDGKFVVNLTSEPNKEGKIVLVNALGVKVFSKELNIKGGRTIEKIDVSQLPTGVYTLLLEQNDEIITKRIMINK